VLAGSIVLLEKQMFQKERGFVSRGWQWLKIINPDREQRDMVKLVWEYRLCQFHISKTITEQHTLLVFFNPDS
jgi:hypothetical protein